MKIEPSSKMASSLPDTPYAEVHFVNKLRRLCSRRGHLVIVVLAIATFCNNVIFSCIAPFYPKEAAERNISQTAIGITFGLIELSSCVSSTILGPQMPRIGVTNMFLFGMFGTAITTLLFGALDFIYDTTTYIAYSMTIRCLEGVAVAAMMTSAFAIVTTMFPKRLSTTIGFLEVFTGLGLTLGPPFGGALYEVGHFVLPFAVLGTVVLLSGVMACFLVPKLQNGVVERPNAGEILRLLKIPNVALGLFVNFLALASSSFLDSNLEHHVAEFGLSPITVGLVFMIAAVCYAFGSILFGWMVDHKPCSLEAMLVGSLISCIAFLFIGPVPVIPLPKSLELVCISQAIYGIGSAAAFIPTFGFCLRAAYNAGFEVTLKTYAIVSGMFQTFLSLGAFFGSTGGSTLTDLIGFNWAAAFIAMLNFIQVKSS